MLRALGDSEGHVCAASRVLIRRSSVVVLNGLGSMEETASAGSGISKTAKGFAEL